MATIEFRNICKYFGSTKVLDNLNLTIENGKFTVLVGPSGCGKTTLLRIIAGIGPSTSGECLMDGKDITDMEPARRGIAMVFQNYALYPTMNVRENIEFGLKNIRVPKEERERLIKEYGEIVGLLDQLQKSPSQLSGGQRQRVALARAMVKIPKVFLMDEPLSNLDAKLRVQMRGELIELQKRLNATFVYVTHDQVEAMSMADTIVLMNKGEIQQQGAPGEIYDNPNNVFTAQFIGTPPMNILGMANGCRLGYRPEVISLHSEEPECAYYSKGKIVTREMLGSETLYKIRMVEGDVMVKSQRKEFCIGQEIWLSVPMEKLYFFDENGNRIREHDKNYKECCQLVGGGV